MTRKASLANYYTSDELKQKYLKSKELIESRRWHLLWKISLGWTIKESAIAVGINYDYAKEIVKKYNDLGEPGVQHIKSKHMRGKKALLTQEQLENLGKELESKLSNGETLSGPQVARWIEKETGIKNVWNQRGWDYIKKAEVLMANS
ncbi:MAG: helix-turn-helix domain-containing protein [Limnoraphis sp.]